MKALTALQSLDTSGCVRLQQLPPLDGLTSLQEQRLSGCHELQQLPSLHHLTHCRIYLAVFVSGVPRLIEGDLWKVFIRVSARLKPLKIACFGTACLYLLMIIYKLRGMPEPLQHLVGKARTAEVAKGKESVHRMTLKWKAGLDAWLDSESAAWSLTSLLDPEAKCMHFEGCHWCYKKGMLSSRPQEHLSGDVVLLQCL
jgi:hypothetical protein